MNIYNVRKFYKNENHNLFWMLLLNGSIDIAAKNNRVENL